MPQRIPGRDQYMKQSIDDEKVDLADNAYSPFDANFKIHSMSSPTNSDISIKESAGLLNSEKMKSIVLIAGFEQFNLNLYKEAAKAVESKVDNVSIYVFTDNDIITKPDVVAAALEKCDVLFASLIFDYQQIIWMKKHIANIPYRFCFESALELMSETKVGGFKMSADSGGGGPPAPVKAILKQFGSGKEEDRLAGYLKFLKFGPKLLNFIPGQKAKDLKTWLTVYSYWNQGAAENVESMLYCIIRDLELFPNIEKAEDIPLPSAVRETPLTGLVKL
jgi:magnesium chelatase subunit H